MSRTPMTTDSKSEGYAVRLMRAEAIWWKRLLDVQAPYRWNLKRLELGYVLDVGCGVGRNLLNLGGRGVGVDPNVAGVAEARRRGLSAFVPDDYLGSDLERSVPFDTILVSHVLEHMPFAQGLELIRQYLPGLKPDGRLVLITPQEAGYRSDVTHVEFIDIEKSKRLAAAAGFKVERAFSFPFPRVAGKLFKYNEFVVLGRRDASSRR